MPFVDKLQQLFTTASRWLSSETRLNESEYVQISRWAVIPGVIGHALFWWMLPYFFQLHELAWARMLNILAFLLLPLLASKVGAARPFIFRSVWLVFCTWHLYVFPWLMYTTNGYNQYWLVSIVFFSMLATVMLRSYDIVLVASIGISYVVASSIDPYHVKLGAVFSAVTSFIALFGMSYVRYIQQRLVRARMNLAAAYAQLQQTDRMKDEFILNVAHELRTPVAVINVLIEQLEVDQSSKTYKLLHATMKQFKRQTDELLNALSDRSVTLNLTMINATDFVNDIYDTFSVIAAAESIELRVLVKARITFTADFYQLTTAVSNLVGNAVKFTRPGGMISVVINADYAGNLYIKVRDTGIGIPADKIDKIFERYFQVDNSKARSGFGIGLTLVRDIVRAHSGSINVSSHEDEGTTFVIKLPAAAVISSNKPSLKLSSRSISAQRPSLSKVDATALVIDDNSTLRSFYVDVVKSAGVSAVGFESPVSALSYISSNAPKLSFIISDVGMPDMDGYELLAALRAISGYESTHVVLVSGYSRRAIESRVRDLNVSVLEKPVNSHQLLEHISKFQTATEHVNP